MYCEATHKPVPVLHEDGPTDTAFHRFDKCILWLIPCSHYGIVSIQLLKKPNPLGWNHFNPCVHYMVE